MATSVRRILIADNHDILRRGVRTLVESQPNRKVVAEATTGPEVLLAARDAAPDIAIIDYDLPEMNGLKVTIALKRELPWIEVLVYTTHDEEELVMDMLRAGARGFVLKSDSGTQLSAAIDALSMHQSYFSAAVSEALLDQFLRNQPTSTLNGLTHREREVVQLIAEGKINREIGEALDISVKTVETHRAAAMHKLNLRTTAELVRYAVRRNIIEA